MIYGLMSLLQHSWRIYAWKDLREFHNLRIHAGFNSCENRFGASQQTNYHRHIQSAAKSVAQMKPKHCLMEYHTERAQLS